MEIFRKTMDFFPKNSHVFRISWEIIEGTREEKRKTKRKKEYTQRNPQQKQIHGKNKSMAKTKGIYDKNKFTAKTNPRQKQIHDKNNKDSMAETNPRQKQ